MSALFHILDIVMKYLITVFHQDSMSVKCVRPYTPLLYSKTGVRRGIPTFLIYAPKHRLWVLVVGSNLYHNLLFEQK